MNDRAMQILTFIESYTNKEGRPPTIRDIGVQFEIASTNGVRYYLDMLEKSELLRRTGKTSRGLLSMRPSVPHQRSQRPHGIPIIGRVAAGEPILADSNHDGDLAIGDVFGDPGGLFALRVRGDSMVDAGILEGDYVIVRPAEHATAGDIIVARLDEEATVKYYQPRGSHIELVAANPNYAPIRVDEGSGFHIEGIVTGVLRTLTR